MLNLPAVEATRQELAACTRKQWPGSAHQDCEAETGAHDDLVSAQALATLCHPTRGRARAIATPESWGLLSGWAS